MSNIKNKEKVIEEENIEPQILNIEEHELRKKIEQLKDDLQSKEVNLKEDRLSSNLNS